MRTRSPYLLATLLLGGLLAHSATASGAAPEWITKVGPATAEAKRSGRPILVDLYASWCGWCKELDRQVYSTPRFQEYARKFVLLRVDTEDGGEGSALDARFEVESLPTTLVLSSDLMLIGKVEGFAPTEEYLGMIEAQLKDFLDYETKAQAALAGKDTAVQRSAAAEAHMRGDGKTAAALYRKLAVSGSVPPDIAGALQYMLADALRLAKDWDGAKTALNRATAEAERLHDADLLERSQMLAWNVAEDSGDCRGAKERVERFLRDHPQSTLVGRAKRALSELDKSAQCT
ncbi:MAG: thioredoxin family protein [Acidobacteriota bacterium]